MELDLFTTEEDDELAPGAGQTYLLDRSLLGEITTTVHPQDAVAVAAWRPHQGVPVDARCVLVLSGLSDPGNTGTLIRTAAALGLDAVVLTKSSCDPSNPKVVRASAGSIFAVEVWSGANVDAVFDSLGSIPHVGSVVRGGEPADVVAARCPDGFALWLGGEPRGLGDLDLDRMDGIATVPIRDAVESLNAASAGAILLWEMTRTHRVV